MKSIAALLAVAAAAAATTATAAAPPVASAPGLLVSHEDSVYVEGRRVARGGNAVWSPDGTRIAYVNRDVILVADRDGRNARRLARGHSPAWSPDGATIAYVSGRDVYTIRAAGGKPRRATFSAEPWLLHNTPAYSPDGETIALAATTDAFNSDIFLLRDGRLTRLTRSQGTHDTFGEEHGPTFSPDGKRIVFVSNRAGSFDLFSIGVDGRGERQLTRTPKRDESQPRYSRDGKRILFVAGGLVAYMRADGTGVRELGAGTSADWR